MEGSDSHDRLPLGMTAAINKLPDEVLSEIFLIGRDIHVFGPPSRFPYLPAKSSHSFPIVIASVCAKWREVALDTAQLWSVICYGSGYGGSRWKETEPVQLFVERSKETLLDLRLCGSHEQDLLPYEKDVNIQHDAIQFSSQLFRNEMRRTRRLTLVIPYPLIVSHLRSIGPVLSLLRDTPAPELTSFDIELLGMPSAPDGERETFNGFWPTLREVSIIGLHMNFPNGALRSLQVLSLRLMTARMICNGGLYRVLRECTHLESLSIADMSTSGYDFAAAQATEVQKRADGEATPIHLPHLTRVEVVDVPLTWMTGLAFRLRVPELRHFVGGLYTDVEASPAGVPRLTWSCKNALIHLPLNDLRSFCWDGRHEDHAKFRGISQSEAGAILSGMQRLEVLEMLGQYSPAREFVLALWDDARPKSTEQLCCELNNIKLYDPDLKSLLVSMLKLRISSERLSSIRSLTVPFETPDDQLTALSRLVDDLNVFRIQNDHLIFP